MRRNIYPVVVLILVATLSAWAQGKRPMTLIDLLQVPQISDPQLSPDGKQILFVKATADWKTNTRISHIWRIGADGNGLLQLTSGARGEREPRWSPDGSRIAFITRRDAGGSADSGESAQIYLMDATAGEGIQLSHHATGVSSIHWSPAGSEIYFLANDAKSSDEKERDRLKDDVFAFDEDYKQNHVWKIAVADKKEAKITDGNYSVTDYTLSPDGTRMAVVRGPNPLLGSREFGEVFIMNSSGSDPVQLTKNRVVEGDVQISPDNSQVLFTTGSNAQFEPYYISSLFVVPARGGTPQMVLPDFPHDVEGVQWSQDGKSIYMLCNMGVHSELFEMDMASRKPRQLTNGDRAIAGWSLVTKAGKHVFTVSDPVMPDEVFLLGVRDTAPVQVTHVTEYVSREFALPKEEKIQWKGADGATVEGILTYPLDYQQGKRYPLAVYSHGGPQGSDKLAFSPWREYRPILAARGYAVVRTNYRGSTGYGNKHLRDMIGHYFNNAHKDVLAAVDYLIDRGIADPDRLVKFGWSAGGHMTNKMITFTDRFKAASSGAGAANWVSMYAQSDVRNNRTPWFGGTPWQNEAPINLYWDNSPLKEVWKVKTPTLFLVGDRDERVPKPQAIEMYRALKTNGVETRLYIAPREPHGWGELRHQLFKMNVELDWFETHLKHSYTWEKAPGESSNDKSAPRTPATASQ